MGYHLSMNELLGGGLHVADPRLFRERFGFWGVFPIIRLTRRAVSWGTLASALNQIVPMRSLLIDGLGPDLEVATCHAAARDEPGIFIAKHVHVVEILLARQNRSVADVLGVVVLQC